MSYTIQPAQKQDAADIAGTVAEAFFEYFEALTDDPRHVAEVFTTAIQPALHGCRR